MPDFNWVSEKINEAKQNKLNTLVMVGNNRNRLTEFPNEILELEQLQGLDLSNNSISIIPESICKLKDLVYLQLGNNNCQQIPVHSLPKLRKLYLSNNGLSKIQDDLFELENLEILHLSGNRIDQIQESISKLNYLESLQINHNRLNQLPKGLFSLPELTNLDFSDNQLGSCVYLLDALQKLIHLAMSNIGLETFPDSLSKIVKLRNLTISNNNIRTLPQRISELQNLETLSSINCNFDIFPENISDITNLHKLNISNNNIREYPVSLRKLENLTSLIIRKNNVTIFPEIVTDLPKLQDLDCSENQITKIPDSIGKMSCLNTLKISSNPIIEFSESIASLEHLEAVLLMNNNLSKIPKVILKVKSIQRLNLSNNRITSIHSGIRNLTKLTFLDLSQNNIVNIPKRISELKNLETFVIHNNPIINPPYQIARQGIRQINSYFQEVDLHGQDKLYEAKLILLGPSNAGKTTLAKKIINPNYKLKFEDSTRGVDIYSWNFQFGDNQLFRANIWDFGGQEIYYSTHRFFLTTRSLYVLLVSSRLNNNAIHYWLNTIYLLSHGSPVIIIENEVGDLPISVDESQLKAKFPNLVKFIKTNFSSNRGLSTLVDEIKHNLRTLPHIGSKLPNNWLNVRAALESDGRNYIPVEDFYSLCKRAGLTEEKALSLSGYFHDIGVFLHYQNDSRLKDIVFLKPRWGTEAAYKVLQNENVIAHNGQFTEKDLESIWSEKEDYDCRHELLTLMKNFNICYEIPGNNNSYIAPVLLPNTQPKYPWNENDNLFLRYRYDYFPKGIINILTVLMSKYIEDQKVWNKGVLLRRGNTLAEVIEFEEEREIRIRLSGLQKKEFLSIINDNIEDIHKRFSNLVYEKLIPCNCSECQSKQFPYFYPYEELQNFLEKGIPLRQCGYSGISVQIINLIENLRGWVKPQELEELFMKNRMIENKKNEITVKVDGNAKIQNFVVDGMLQDSSRTIKPSFVNIIQDSFNRLESSTMDTELKETMEQLANALLQILPMFSEKQSEEAIDDYSRLVNEVTKEKPSQKWYTVSIDGLIKAAENLNKLGTPVIDLSKKILSLLTFGIINESEH